MKINEKHEKQSIFKGVPGAAFDCLYTNNKKTQKSHSNVKTLMGIVLIILSTVLINTTVADLIIFSTVLIQLTSYNMLVVPLQFKARMCAF